MVEFKLVSISPNEAALLLEKNIKNNRKQNKNKIERYADDIINNRWIDESGETIKFNTRNELIDGQNRLAAVIKSGLTVNMWVAKNCSDKSFMVIDAGNRSIQDSFKINNVPNSNIAAGVTQILLVHDKVNNAEWKQSTTLSGRANHVRSSTQGTYEYYLDNKDIIDKAIAYLKPIVYDRNRFKPIAPIKVLGFLTILLKNGAYMDVVQDFATQLTKGVGACETVAYTMNYLQTKKIKKDIIPIAHTTELLHKTWNSFVTRKYNQKHKINGEIPKLIYIGG